METQLKIQADKALALLDEKLNILQLYPFGSHVYGSANEASDYDFIVIVDQLPTVGSLERFPEQNIDLHYYTTREFQLKLDHHDIQALECYFLPNSLFESKIDFQFELDKHLLRPAISTIVNNSWVKGKKKLIVSGDYDQRLALKSIFHSIRILGLGIQIASHGKIINYKEYNWLLNDLYTMAQQADKDLLWQQIESKYKQKLYKAGKTKFRLLCPKAEQHLVKKRRLLQQLLTDRAIEPTEELIEEIMMIFTS